MAETIVMYLAVLLAPALQQPDQGDTDAAEARHLKNIRQLTSDATPDGRGFERAGEAYFSPDARTIIFQAVRGKNPFYQIFTQ